MTHFIISLIIQTALYWVCYYFENIIQNRKPNRLTNQTNTVLMFDLWPIFWNVHNIYSRVLLVNWPMATLSFSTKYYKISVFLKCIYLYNYICYFICYYTYNYDTIILYYNIIYWRLYKTIIKIIHCMNLFKINTR